MQFYRTWKWTLRQKCTILKISFSSFKLQVALLSWSPKFHWMNSLMSQILEIRSNFIIDCNHEFNWALKPWHVRVQTFLSNSSEALLPSVILTSVHFNWHDLGSKKHLTSNLCATLYAYTHAYPGTWLSILTSQDHQVFLQLYFSKRFFSFYSFTSTPMTARSAGKAQLCCRMMAFSRFLAVNCRSNTLKLGSAVCWDDISFQTLFPTGET